MWLAIYYLLEFHGPGGQIIDLSPDAIVSLRVPRQEEHLQKDIRCIINTSDGKFSAVIEDCEEVRRMLEQEREK